MGKIHQSVVIPASPDQVWGRLRNFHDFSWGSNVIETCEPVGEKQANEIGARRLLNGIFHETLQELNEAERILKYSIDDGPDPLGKEQINNYFGVIKVSPAEDNSSRVEWSSSWEGKDQEVENFCSPIYVALLNSLKESFSTD